MVLVNTDMLVQQQVGRVGLPRRSTCPSIISVCRLCISELQHASRIFVIRYTMDVTITCCVLFEFDSGFPAGAAASTVELMAEKLSVPLNSRTPQEWPKRIREMAQILIMNS